MATDRLANRQEAEGVARYRSRIERDSVVYVIEMRGEWFARRESELPENRDSYYLLGAAERGILH